MNRNLFPLVFVWATLVLLSGLLLLKAPSDNVLAQGKPVKEDWSLEHQEIQNAPEAELLVRHGSINNLGFGWPAGFDPFRGAATPVHPFPWQPNPKAAVGTDRILVVSSYQGKPPGGRQDGYTGTTRRPENQPVPIPITFTPPKFPIRGAVLQVFVDDFQAPVWGSRYQVTMNGWRVPELEAILNSLNQTGPIGKLVTYQLPAEVVKTLDTGKLTITVDDPTTGAGDGFAFDFFRLLINPKGSKYQGLLTGRVTDAATAKFIQGAKVSAGGVVSTKTDVNGMYQLTNVPAGLATITFSAKGYTRITKTIDLLAGKSQTLDAQLKGISLDQYLVEEAASQPHRMVIPREEKNPSKEPIAKTKDPETITKELVKEEKPLPTQDTQLPQEKSKSLSPKEGDSPSLFAWELVLAVCGVLFLVLLSALGVLLLRRRRSPTSDVPSVSLQRCLACGNQVQVAGGTRGMKFRCPKCGTERILGK